MNMILIVISIAIVVFSIIYIAALRLASRDIFSGSGSPINMANVLLQSILAAGQIIVGLAILGIVAFLIIDKYITSEVGLPIIASIAGYLVGRTFDNKIVR